MKKTIAQRVIEAQSDGISEYDSQLSEALSLLQKLQADVKSAYSNLGVGNKKTAIEKLSDSYEDTRTLSNILRFLLTEI